MIQFLKQPLAKNHLCSSTPIRNIAVTLDIPEIPPVLLSFPVARVQVFTLFRQEVYIQCRINDELLYNAK